MITRTITGYKWGNFGAFTSDLTALNISFGYPKQNARTETSMRALESLNDQGKVDFYYIGKVDQFIDLLGEPEEFEIKIIDGITGTN